MDNKQDQTLTPPGVNESRRRLTMVGLAAPAVLGVLASRPVLGQSLHQCTPSGHISGFASFNGDPAACRVGNSISYYAGSRDNWPGGSGSYFRSTNGKPRLFRESPNGVSLPLFADAYQRVEKQTQSGNITIKPATVYDVLKGFPVKDDGTPDTPPNTTITLVPKSPNADLELGQEAVVACMNALSIGNFPISAQMVVNMFNNVFLTGFDNVTSTNNWNQNELKTYFQTLRP